MMKHASRGPSFFLQPDNPQLACISRGLEIYKGFYTSVRAGQSIFFISIDLANCFMVASGSLPRLISRYAANAIRGGAAAPNIASLSNQVQIELGRWTQLHDLRGRI